MTVKVYWYIERQYKKIKQFVRCIYTNDAISDCFAKVFFSVDAADGGTELSCHKRAVNQIEGVIINVRGVLKQLRGLDAKMVQVLMIFPVACKNSLPCMSRSLNYFNTHSTQSRFLNKKRIKS